MYTTVTVLSSHISSISHEIFHSSKNLSQFVHSCRKFCQASQILFNQSSNTLFITNSYGALKIRLTNRSVSSLPNVTSNPSEKLPLTKNQAKIAVSSLSQKERDILLTALQEQISADTKANFEGQLAALRWRSKFGRPSKLRLGDVDPTGNYCPVPEDWLLKKCAENVAAPTTKELMFVALANAIPFIGFGFLDNFIMIVAGDQIEMMLNRKFPISTMAAAALGNTVSDVIGIGSVHYVETLAEKIGVKAPDLSPAQLNLPPTRVAVNVGRILGVTVGCLIGMTPIPIVHLFHQG